MNKYLSIVLLGLCLASCHKDAPLKNNKLEEKFQKSSISMNEAVSRIRSSNSALSTLGLQSILTKSTPIDFNSIANGCIPATEVAGGLVFRTYGNAKIYEIGDNRGKMVSMETKNYGGVVSGSGFAVKFPFKYGSTYAIKILVSHEAHEVNGDRVHSVKRRPSLQSQLANGVEIGQNGCGDMAPVNLLTYPGSVQDVPANNNTQTVSFTPDKCYDFIRFSALPNLTGNSYGEVRIEKMEIVETNAIGIIGPEILNTNQEMTYTVEYNGFPINSNFNWTVTGDLQIIGNAVGPNVVIKSGSLKGGTIVASLNGCNLLTKVLKNTEMELPDISNYGWKYGGSPYHYSVSNVPGATSFTWEVGPGGQIVGSHSDRTVIVLFDQIPGNTYDRNVSISVTAHGPFGSSPRATSYQTIRGCDDCPLQ